MCFVFIELFIFLAFEHLGLVPVVILSSRVIWATLCYLVSCLSLVKCNVLCNGLLYLMTATNVFMGNIYLISGVAGIMIPHYCENIKNPLLFFVHIQVRYSRILTYKINICFNSVFMLIFKHYITLYSVKY